MRSSTAITVGLAVCMGGCGGDLVISSLHAKDAISADPFEGVTVTTTQGVDTSGSNGRADFEHPADGAFTLIATAEGIPTHTFEMEGYGGPFALDYGLVRRASIADIGEDVGLTWDESKAIVEATAFWLDDNESASTMGGALLSIDTSYDGVAAESPSGWALSETQTLGANDRATLGFVNVPVGSTTVSLVPPEGTDPSSCGVFPSESGAGLTKTIETTAGEISVVIFLCKR